jgi:hypothetical protein
VALWAIRLRSLWLVRVGRIRPVEGAATRQRTLKLAELVSAAKIIVETASLSALIAERVALAAEVERQAGEIAELKAIAHGLDDVIKGRTTPLSTPS